MEQMLMETMIRHMESKAVISDSQRDITKSKSKWNWQFGIFRKLYDFRTFFLPLFPLEVFLKDLILTAYWHSIYNC